MKSFSHLIFGLIVSAYMVGCQTDISCLAVKKFPRDVDAQKDFISQWTTNNISDLDYSYALGHLHCDESPVFVRASMRSRFSNLIIGDSDLIDCYSKLGVSFDCVPCGKGR